VIVPIHDHPYALQMYVFPSSLAATCARRLLRLVRSLPRLPVRLLLRPRSGLRFLALRLSPRRPFWLIGSFDRAARRHGAQIACPGLVITLVQISVLGILTAGKRVGCLAAFRLREFLSMTGLDRRPLALVRALER